MGGIIAVKISVRKFSSGCRSFSKVFSAWHADNAWWVGVGMQQGVVGTWSDSEAIKEALIKSVTFCSLLCFTFPLLCCPNMNIPIMLPSLCSHLVQLLHSAQVFRKYYLLRSTLMNREIFRRAIAFNSTVSTVGS